MASEEDLEGRQRDQDNRRHASRLSQEPANLIRKSVEEELRELQERFEEERKARIEAEEKCNELQSQLEKRKRLVTPTNKGTSGSDGKLSIASRVFRDQLIDIF